MDNYLYLLLSVIVIILVMIVARRLNVKEFGWEKFNLKFWEPKNFFRISPCFSLDPVISMDGKVYKIQIIVSVLTNTNNSPVNWFLDINVLNKFVFKQYFYQDKYGYRHPLRKLEKLPLRKNENFVIGLEFDPKGEYKEILFQQKNYKATLICKTTEGKVKKRLKFSVRKRNLAALRSIKKDAKEKEQANIISFPIID